MLQLAAPPEGGARTRSACVVVGAGPAAVAAIGESDRIVITPHRLGTLVTGTLGALPVEYAEHFAGPIYDVMYSPVTGWFSVTVFAGTSDPDAGAHRYDNRPGTDPGYPRIHAVLGATTPADIVRALELPDDWLETATRLAAP